jgi:hypothetical protein
MPPNEQGSGTTRWCPVLFAFKSRLVEGDRRSSTRCSLRLLANKSRSDASLRSDVSEIIGVRCAGKSEPKKNEISFAQVTRSTRLRG